MVSIQNVLFQLSSGFLNETMIPNNYLFISDIQFAIRRYNWSPYPSNISGWTTLIRNQNYSS